MLFGNIRAETDEISDEGKKEQDPSIIVTDADGIAEGEAGADVSGQNLGGDSTDSSTLT